MCIRDRLMEDKEHEITEMQEKMLQKADKMEQLLQLRQMF